MLFLISLQTFSTEHLSNISAIHPHRSETRARTNYLKARDKTTDMHKRTRSTKTTLSLLTHSPGCPTGNQVNVFPTHSLNTSHVTKKLTVIPGIDKQHHTHNTLSPQSPYGSNTVFGKCLFF